MKSLSVLIGLLLSLQISAQESCRVHLYSANQVPSIVLNAPNCHEGYQNCLSILKERQERGMDIQGYCEVAPVGRDISFLQTCAFFVVNQFNQIINRLQFSESGVNDRDAYMRACSKAQSTCFNEVYWRNQNPYGHRFYCYQDQSVGVLGSCQANIFGQDRQQIYNFRQYAQGRSSEEATRQACFEVSSTCRSFLSQQDTANRSSRYFNAYCQSQGF